MGLSDDYIDIDSLNSKEVLPTRLIVGVIVAMFISVQMVFIALRPSDEWVWQAIGMIVSTNFAAVWLTIRGNSQIEDVQEAAKKVYRPEILKFINWEYALLEKIGAELDENPEDMLDELAPLLAKTLIRYSKEKRRIERLNKIEDGEVFMDAVQEMMR